MDKYERNSDESQSDISQEDDLSYHSAQSDVESPSLQPSEPANIQSEEGPESESRENQAPSSTHKMRIDPEEPRAGPSNYRPKYQIYRGPKEFYRKKEYEEPTEPSAEPVTRPVRIHRKETVKYVKKEPKKAAPESVPEQKPETEVREFHERRGYGFEKPRRGNRRGRGYRQRRQWGRHENYEEDYYYNNEVKEESWKKHGSWKNTEPYKPHNKEPEQESPKAKETSSPTSSPKQRLNLEAPPFIKTSSKTSPTEGGEKTGKLEKGLTISAQAFVPKTKTPAQPQQTPQYMPYVPGIYQNVVLMPPQSVPMVVPGAPAMQYSGNYYAPQVGGITQGMAPGFYGGYTQQM